MTGPVRTCRCGHDETEHEHWRAGTDCGRCGWQQCPGFDPMTGRPPISPELRRLLAVVIGIPLAIVVTAAVASIAGGDAVPIAVAVLLSVIGAIAVCWVIRPEPDHRHDDEEDSP